MILCVYLAAYNDAPPFSVRHIQCYVDSKVWNDFAEYSTVSRLHVDRSELRWHPHFQLCRVRAAAGGGGVASLSSSCAHRSGCCVHVDYMR